MNKKYLLKIIPLVIALIITLGCGNSSNPGTDAGTGNNAGSADAGNTAPANDSSPQLSGKVTFWDGVWNEETFPHLKALWDAQYPDIELVGEYQSDQGMSDRYMLALQSGTAPDVVLCALDWVTTFGSAGLLAPLDEYIAADNIDTNAFVQGAVNASTINGQLYGLPFRSETFTLYYNVDILSEAGYNEPPETWEEVLEVAAATNRDNVSGFGLVGANFGNVSFQYITMLRSSGGDILTADNSASALDSAAASSSINLYKELAKYAPASLLENDNVANRNLFASGRVAMYVSGIFDAPEIINSNPDLNFACALYPTAGGAERKTILGGWSVAIPGSTANKDVAWTFVKFLTSSDIARTYTNTYTGTGVPAERFNDYPAEILAPNSRALDYAVALPAVAPIVGIRQTIFDNIALVLSDSLTPEAGLAQMHNSVNDLLAEG